MAADVSSTVHLYQYQAFESIWHSIDYNQFGDLIDNPELYEKINEKQQGLTPLHLAILRKNKMIATFLLENGADPNVSSKGRTPLYTATLYGEEQIVEALLDHGAEPDAMCRDYSGIAPIHLAAVKGRLDILELLEIQGANLSIRSPQYGTALHVAAKKNHKYVATFLVDHGIDLNVLTDEGETALHVACRSGYEDIVNLILKSNLPLDPLIKDKVDGNTGMQKFIASVYLPNIALHVAALYQRWNIVRDLSKKYPKLLTVLNNNEGKSPLFYVFAVLRDPIRETFVKAMNRHQGFAACINDTNTSDVVLLCRPPNDAVTPVKLPLAKSSDNARIKDESRVYVHKAMLWSRCPALRDAMPKLGKDPNSDLDAVDTTKYSHAVVMSFAHYLYTDELKCTLPLMAELRDCAAQFHCERLAALCESLLGKNVNLPESTFKSDLLQLINSPLFSDVKFTLRGAAGPEVVYAHKFILVHRSEFFRAMFMPTAALHSPQSVDLVAWMGSISLKESSDRLPNIQLQDTSVIAFKTALRYMYNWSAGKDLNGENAVDILEVATRLMLDGLSYQTQHFLCLHITLENVAHLLDVAFAFEAILLKEEALDLVLRNYMTVASSADYKALPEHVKTQVQFCLGTGNTVKRKQLLDKQPTAVLI